MGGSDTLKLEGVDLMVIKKKSIFIGNEILDENALIVFMENYGKQS